MNRNPSRREFVKTGLLTAGAAAAVGPATAFAQEKKRKWNLRYAPRLDFLKKLPIPERLEKFAAWGFDGTEYNGLTRHKLEEVEQIRKKLDSLKMEMGIFVVNFGLTKPWMTDPALHGEFLKALDNALKYHEVIGNRSCTVVAGGERKDVPREKQTQHVIDCLKAAAERLEGTKLTLVLEPLNVLVSHPGYFVVTSPHANQIMKAVGSPHVKILFDIFHQQISEGNIINNIRKYWDEIGYFQVGDVPGRKEPGTGEVNWRNVFKAIHEKGYKGLVGMEHGLSKGNTEEGVKACFEAYREADSG